MRSLTYPALALAVLASSTAGCLGQTYVIPKNDLVALSGAPAETRGQRVRVIQQFASSEQPPPADRVDSSTTIIFVPHVHVDGGHSHGRPVPPRPTTPPPSRPDAPKPGLGSNLARSKAEDGRAWIILAAFVAIGLAATEGARFDGWANLHPMHPVHLFGPYGEYVVMPLAQIDQQTALWARRAVIREGEGPWNPLERAPLDRAGFTYSLLLGGAEIPSAVTGDEGGTGFQGHIQLGYFPTQTVGLLLDVGLGWRANGIGKTVYDSRWGGELQILPLSAGRFHAGGYGSLALGQRFEDGVPDGDAASTVFGGGGMLQLELTTRLAITGRFGLTSAYDTTASEVGVGVAIY
jgi:hypothetical protein